MKKQKLATRKPLTLSPEIVRSLEPDDLPIVRGGKIEGTGAATCANKTC